jgi:hypothetical protein
MAAFASRRPIRLAAVFRGDGLDVEYAPLHLEPSPLLGVDGGPVTPSTFRQMGYSVTDPGEPGGHFLRRRDEQLQAVSA